MCVCVCGGHTDEVCEKAEPIEVVFGGETRVSRRNHILDGDPDPHKKGHF